MASPPVNNESSSNVSNSDKNSDTEMIVKKPEQPRDVKSIIRWLVHQLGAPQDELAAPWIQKLAIWNGIVHMQQMYGEFMEKMRFPRHPDNKTKLAAVSFMDRKFVGFFRASLLIHILSGTIAVQCSWVAIALEKRRPELAKKLAKIASFAETFFHAPTALAMSPIVYGDKGTIPLMYGMTSVLLGLSGASALVESTDDSTPKRADGTFPELRRMAITLGIFLYVRLYVLMRGAGGFFRPQKYAAGVMTAGAAMLPVAWQRGVMPATFWGLMVYNWRTVAQTSHLIRTVGVDEAMKRQWRLA